MSEQNPDKGRFFKYLLKILGGLLLFLILYILAFGITYLFIIFIIDLLKLNTDTFLISNTYRFYIYLVTLIYNLAVFFGLIFLINLIIKIEE